MPFRIAKGIVIAALVLVVVRVLMVVISKAFTEQEKVIRSDWTVDAGELLAEDDVNRVGVYASGVESDLEVYRILPDDISDDGFTYYDVDVQERLASVVEALGSDADGTSWTLESPLAILNPYGTGSNGLYLRFGTDSPTRVSYTVETEGCSDFSAEASDGLASEHEIQLIGLVPGADNHVTLVATDEAGGTQTLEFDISMPKTDSGYTTQLSYEDGASTAELSDGLYAMLRTNGYLGYCFMFDNDGTMRYEMVTEGLGPDRILNHDGEIIICASASKIARIDALGRVVAVYDLGDYVLHHDINEVDDSTIMATVEESGSELVEDKVIEIDLDTGEIAMLVDFSEFLADYREGFTSPITALDAFYWQAGEWDWIHINTVQYVDSDDSLIVSSRETSTIIKVGSVHTDPHVEWLCGDPAFWEGTPYEGLSLDPVGDFKFQYGQHTVEYAGAGEEDGVYYLRMFDNNYYKACTREGYDPDLPGGTSTIQTDLLDMFRSYVYVYMIDENEGTFELVQSFDVPYSSLVSGAEPDDVWESYHVDCQDWEYSMDGRNWVVNSGESKVFGEYDADGELIREFSYKATLQGYRTVKYSFEGFWFAEE